MMAVQVAIQHTPTLGQHMLVEESELHRTSIYGHWSLDEKYRYHRALSEWLQKRS